MIKIVNAKKFRAYPHLGLRLVVDVCDCGNDICYYETDSPWGGSRDSECRRICAKCRSEESRSTTPWRSTPVGASKAFHKRRHSEPLSLPELPVLA